MFAYSPSKVNMFSDFRLEWVPLVYSPLRTAAVGAAPEQGATGIADAAQDAP